MRWVCRRLAYAGVAVMVSTATYADDAAPTGDITRDQLARVIGVLRLDANAASQSCLDALHEVHTTEDQVKVLQSRPKADLALAQDVMESDYENAKEICGADSQRVCAAPSMVKGMDAACDMLHRGGKPRLP